MENELKVGWNGGCLADWAIAAGTGQAACILTQVAGRGYCRGHERGLSRVLTGADKADWYCMERVAEQEEHMDHLMGDKNGEGGTLLVHAPVALPLWGAGPRSLWEPNCLQDSVIYMRLPSQGYYQGGQT